MSFFSSSIVMTPGPPVNFGKSNSFRVFLGSVDISKYVTAISLSRSESESSATITLASIDAQQVLTDGIGEKLLIYIFNRNYEFQVDSPDVLFMELDQESFTSSVSAGSSSMSLSGRVDLVQGLGTNKTINNMTSFTNSSMSLGLDTSINPLDNVIFSNGSMLAGTITYSITPSSKTMTIKEYDDT